MGVSRKLQEEEEMSVNLNDAAMAGNVEEVLIRLNMGEDVNQKCYPRYSTPLHDAVACGRLAIRYGQDEIEEMLKAKGAKEKVDIPMKKTSVVGEVDPPWVRRVSRREQAA